MGFEQIAQKIGERCNTGEDAAQQRHQEGAVDHSPGLADAAAGEPQQLVRSAGTKRLEQPLVDPRSEEHTSELQSRPHLVCRLLLEKKKKRNRTKIIS